ncbi:MAG: hypoxanthine phosphoribosyltransferase [Syntrophaceae bacterium]|nr:hypoxanthine phosphoribosyltransferase [Syntrophaceae bacterium]
MAMEAMRKSVLYSREAIRERVLELGEEVSRAYEDRNLVVIGVLKGAFMFMADLVRALRIPCRIDFIRVASYGSGTETSGRIELTKDIETDITGKDVLIVEDIIDTGLTLTYLVENLRARNPRSLKVCAFLDKKLRRKVPFEADFVGFTMDDGFVIGYGLDFDEQGRFLPDVCVLNAGK